MEATLTSPKLVTAEELLRMPSGFELVRGELRGGPKTLMPNNAEHAHLAFELAFFLRSYLKSSGTGKGFVEAGFVLAQNPDTVRAPDLAVVLKSRLPTAGEMGVGFFPGAPDLAVEILSPTNSYEEIEDKLDAYLSTGTQVVWIINPKRRTITVHRSEQAPRTVHHPDTLDGGDLLPGFRLPLSELFPG